MPAEEYVLIDIAISFIMVRLAFVKSIEIYSTSQFYLSLVTGPDVTHNISTAESPAKLVAIYEPN